MDDIVVYLRAEAAVRGNKRGGGGGGEQRRGGGEGEEVGEQRRGGGEGSRGGRSGEDLMDVLDQ